MDINILFEYDENRICPEFYQGNIIEAKNEEATFTALVCGHITLYLPDLPVDKLSSFNELTEYEPIGVIKHRDKYATEELLCRNYTDTEIQWLYDNSKFIENNWFEYVVEFKDDREYLYSEPIHNIDDVLHYLNLFITKKYKELDGY